MESLEGIYSVFRVFIASLEHHVCSECAPAARKKEKSLFASRETEKEMCWRGLDVHCRILILSLAFTLPGPSVLCLGAVCSLLSSTAAAVLMDGMWAALLKASPGWVPGK